MKNKRLYSFLMVMVMICSVFLSTSGIVLGASMEGAGTEASPYLIRTVEDLYSIPNNPEAHYKLMNNLDLENVERTPMAEFRGVLDGNQHTLKNLCINGSINSGLFSILRNAKINSLIIQDSEIVGENFLGAITGRIYGSQISQCIIRNVKIKGSSKGVGGIAGESSLNTTITNCIILNSTIDGATEVGGLVGCFHSTTAEQNYSNAIVSGTSYVGGLVGHYGTSPTVKNSYFNKEFTKITTPSDQSRTTTQMYQKSNYIGWDFENVWTIDEGKDYPRLKFDNYQPEEPQPSVRTLKVVLEPDEQLQLAVDEDITENTNMTWSSSDPTITTVDSNGLIKAIKKGNAIITVNSFDNSYTEEIKVLVVDNAKEYRLTIDLKVGEKCRLTIDEAEDLIGSWTSLDSAVVTVTDKGRVTAVQAGLTIITGFDEDGNVVGQIYVRVR